MRVYAVNDIKDQSKIPTSKAEVREKPAHSQLHLPEQMESQSSHLHVWKTNQIQC